MGCFHRYRAFYNYDPLQEGKPPKAEAKPVFWPPEGTPDEIKQVKEEDSKKFHDVSVEVPGMPKLLQQLNDNEITIKRIAGLGFGSQNCFFANDLSHLPDYLRERIGKQVDDSDKQRLRRAAGQFRLGLTMQKQLPGGKRSTFLNCDKIETILMKGQVLSWFYKIPSTRRRTNNSCLNMPLMVTFKSLMIPVSFPKSLKIRSL